MNNQIYIGSTSDLKRSLQKHKGNAIISLKKSGAGFTLIELLIVVAIIGILSAMVVFNAIGPTNVRARDSQRRSDLKQIQIALGAFMADHGFYPSSAALPGCGNPFNSGSELLMQSVPCDPLDNNSYTYIPSDPNKYPGCDNINDSCVNYKIIACLENTSDLNKDGDDGSDDDQCPASDRVSFTINSD